MNNVKTIQKLLETHRFRDGKAVNPDKCTGCVWIGWNHDQHVAEVIDEAIEPLITTVEQLKAIEMSFDVNPPVIRCTGPETNEFWKMYELNTDGTWALLNSASGESEAWLDRDVASEDISLPVVLLWRPEP